MKKKIVLVFVCALVLASSVLAIVSSAAPSTTQAAWLSNRVTAPSADSPVGYRSYFTVIVPSYSSTNRVELAPNTQYYLNSTPFYTTSNGLIPNGVSFTAYDAVWYVEQTLDIPLGQPADRQFYRIYTVVDGERVYYSRSYNSNFVIFESDGSNEQAIQSAYETGVADGIVLGRREGFNEGYDVGYSDGDLEGYQRGLEVADNGSWYNLFYSVIDAPVAVLHSMFDVEILGFNLSSAIGGIVTLCVVIIVVKAVI